MKTIEEARAEMLEKRHRVYEYQIRFEESERVFRERWERTAEQKRQEIMAWARKRYPWLAKDHPGLFEMFCAGICK